VLAGWFRNGARQRAVLAVVMSSLVLAACASAPGRSRLSAIFGNSGGAEDIDSDFFRKEGFCPPVQVRLGTETYRIFASRKEDDPSSLRYQASIADTARECSRPDTGTLAVKLGVEGRVVAGPAGAPGSVNLPVRVAVARQGKDEVLFSQLYSVPVGLQGVPLSASFAQVFRGISFPAGPDDRDMIVFVGFDTGS